LASISIAEPQLVRKGHTRLQGFNERTIAFCGRSVREAGSTWRAEHADPVREMRKHLDRMA